MATRDPTVRTILEMLQLVLRRSQPSRPVQTTPQVLVDDHSGRRGQSSQGADSAPLGSLSEQSGRGGHTGAAGTSRRGGPPGACYECGGYGHWSRECPRREIYYPPAQAVLQASGVGQLGHDGQTSKCVISAPSSVISGPSGLGGLSGAKGACSPD